ncbi:MAG: hypothetical protein K6A80_08025 [Saccharofermentans sp.]|nr:hypothetical protein [Saccharofermentans sp.]
MSTIKEMSKDYVSSVYELCVFLRMNGHTTLGERIFTQAVEISVLSHTSWTTVTNSEFIANLVKTHEAADKLMILMDLVKYLDLGYSDTDKVYKDTEAIHKMSKSSLNTIFSKQGLKTVNKDNRSNGNKPTRQLRDKNEAEKEQKQAFKEMGNETIPSDAPESKEEIRSETSDGLPFAMDMPEGGTEEVQAGNEGEKELEEI